MTITLHHHPFSRAATIIWMLEEVGVPYQLSHVDILAGEQKKEKVVALNPMGKIPVIEDGQTVVSEVAAIGVYLADKYSYGTLAPKIDAPARGTYLRWSFFAPSVIEPGLMAKMNNWTYKSGAAGWGDYDAMIASMEAALANGDYILGKDFSMVDAIFGGTLRYMLRFNMIEKRPRFVEYTDKLSARPAAQKADKRNMEIIVERGLDKR